MNNIESFTVMDGTTPLAPAGPTESENLTSQQQVFTTMILNQQSYDMLSGVSAIVNGHFNGAGVQPSVNENGFFVSAAGLGSWLRSREMKLRADEARALGLAAPLSGVATRPDWNVWLKGTGAYFDGKGGSFDGYTLDVVGGVDRRLTETALVGVLFGYGRSEFDTVTAGTRGSFDADGFHAGGYVGLKLGPSLVLDALVAYTGSGYDNRSGATTGKFDADRATVAAHLTGHFGTLGLKIEPAIGFLFASEWQKAYTDSAGTAHAKRTVTAGRLSVGPKFVLMPLGPFTPWVSGKAEVDFSNNRGAAGSGLPNLGNNVSARISAGIDGALEGGVSITIRGDVSGLGSGDYTAYGGEASVNVPF